MFVKCKVYDGLIESERLVEIQAVDRVDHAEVCHLLIENGALRVYQVGSRKGQVLVELPVESANGNWRLWISEDQVLHPAAS